MARRQNKLPPAESLPAVEVANSVAAIPSQKIFTTLRKLPCFQKKQSPLRSAAEIPRLSRNCSPAKQFSISVPAAELMSCFPRNASGQREKHTGSTLPTKCFRLLARTRKRLARKT